VKEEPKSTRAFDQSVGPLESGRSWLEDEVEEVSVRVVKQHLIW
jgi:hypothetical protein